MDKNMRIPKKIHYCWFGGKPLPQLTLQCIESWKKFCPEYEIIEWNEKNFPVDANQYIHEAYTHRKYAFVSDYARFKILYENGGIYLDTDVELIKPIDDLVYLGCFLGCERAGNKYVVNPGLIMSAEKGSPLFERILIDYSGRRFIQENGEVDTTTVGQMITRILKDNGYVANDTKQSVCGFTIYPSDYFCPMDYDSGQIRLTKNTYSIHHYDYSWADDYSQRVIKRKRIVYNIFPRFCAQYVFLVYNRLCRLVGK